MEPGDDSMPPSPRPGERLAFPSSKPRAPEHELRDRAKAAKLRHKAAKARMKAKHLEDRSRHLNEKAGQMERRADELDRVVRPSEGNPANE